MFMCAYMGYLLMHSIFSHSFYLYILFTILIISFSHASPAGRMVECNSKVGYVEDSPPDAGEALLRLAHRDEGAAYGALQGVPDPVPHGAPHEGAAVGEGVHAGLLPHVV